MKTIDPQQEKTAAFHGYLLGAVAPRPIALASTIDREGRVNLSPFSYFNAFSTNPPILVFSPSRRVRDNTTKHTLENIQEHPETVINIVDFAMVEQMSLSSTEYEKGVNEFVKSGLTEVPSEKVKPPRVGESPAAFECKVKDVVALGDEGGAGNLVICEVIMAHFKDSIFDREGKIDPYKLDPVSRLGGNWYSRAREGLFVLPKPLLQKGIGFDQLPEKIRKSPVLTGNHLARLANVEKLPDAEKAAAFSQHPNIKSLRQHFEARPADFIEQLHNLAKQYLDAQDTESAWLALMQDL